MKYENRTEVERICKELDTHNYQLECLTTNNPIKVEVTPRSMTKVVEEIIVHDSNYMPGNPVREMARNFVSSLITYHKRRVAELTKELEKL